MAWEYYFLLRYQSYNLNPNYSGSLVKLITLSIFKKL